MKISKTKKLVLMGLFVSISIVLRFCVVYFGPAVRIGFGGLPVLLVSLLLGAGPGMLVGAASDIVYALFSGFGWQPLITVGAIFVGLFPALLKGFLLKKFTIPRLYLVMFITELISSVLWTTACLSFLYGTNYWVLLTARGPISLMMTVINTALVFLLYPMLLRMLRTWDNGR